MSDQVGRPDSGAAEPVELAAGGPVDGFQILDLTAGLPISTWRYHWEDPQVRHLGPMAQDWAATFGLGVNDTTIAGVDANGVALVSIQALYRLIGDLRQEVADLRGQIETLLGTSGESGAAGGTPRRNAFWVRRHPRRRPTLAWPAPRKEGGS